MKIEELLDYPVEVLEKMSDAELEKALAPYFDVTRPERVARQKKPEVTQFMDNKFKNNVNTLAGLGVDVSYLLHRKKKK